MPQRPFPRFFKDTRVIKQSCSESDVIREDLSPVRLEQMSYRYSNDVIHVMSAGRSESSDLFENQFSARSEACNDIHHTIAASLKLPQ